MARLGADNGQPVWAWQFESTGNGDLGYASLAADDSALCLGTYYYSAAAHTGDFGQGPVDGYFYLVALDVDGNAVGPLAVAPSTSYSRGGSTAARANLPGCHEAGEALAQEDAGGVVRQLEGRRCPGGEQTRGWRRGERRTPARHSRRSPR
ncbi:hypothetical protein [Nannocystis pusilla]|uniref:hypothetical protein n=1 Tax=Nannocystis pusilla TaxID=889268 RepID=UPI003B7DE52F